MPVSKLKNLAILILILANLMLILLVAPNRRAAQQQEESLRESLCALYAKEGIELLPEAVADTVSLYLLELRENPDADLRAATALLGQQLTAQDDSTRYLSSYQSELGTCSISRSGSFQAQLTGQREWGDVLKASKKMLRNMGFSWEALEAPERVRAGVYEVHAVQSVLGVPVLSGGLTMTYANGCLTELDGMFFTGAGALTRVSDRACLSAGDALVAFLSARYEIGWVGSAVHAMEQGYVRAETAAAASVRLSPAWLLETDAGSFLVNGMTGEVTAAG